MAKRPRTDIKDRPPVPLPAAPPRRESVVLDKERSIMYDLNALIMLEEKYQMPLDEATKLIFPQKDGAPPKLRDIRAFLWVGLAHEEGEDFTEQDAGRLISPYTLQAAVSAMNRAMSQHLPDAPESEDWNETEGDEGKN